jgi:AbrB family looped-hinge helix DNA binding protein
MQTKVSTQGNVLLPGAIRRQLGIKAGDELHADIQNGNIVLRPERRRKRSRKANIVTSPITGLPVLDAGKDSPVLTSETVRDLLSDFP